MNYSLLFCCQALCQSIWSRSLLFSANGTNKARWVQGTTPLGRSDINWKCLFCLNCSRSTNRYTYTQFFFLKTHLCGFEFIFPFGVASLGVGEGGGEVGSMCGWKAKWSCPFLFFFGFGLCAPPHNKTAHFCSNTIPETSVCSTWDYVTRPQPTSAPSIGNLLWLNCQ
jgi:hypothetical protein